MDKENIVDKDQLLLPLNMIKMYTNGAFPMAEGEEINWYLPDVRTIIPIENYNIPRSLKKYMSDCDFEYRYDLATIEVVKRCANREETWISKLIKAYKNMMDFGFLHSVEVYQNKFLVGGLYGVTYKGAFYGESMFSDVSQASKCALIKLLEKLKEKGFLLLDVQFQTEHLSMFGAKEISFEDYMQINIEAFSRDVKFL